MQNRDRPAEQPDIKAKGAFNEARGFPAPTIGLLSKQCFITVQIFSTGKDTPRLDLARWRVTTNGKDIPRFLVPRDQEEYLEFCAGFPVSPDPTEFSPGRSS